MLAPLGWARESAGAQAKKSRNSTIELLKMEIFLCDQTLGTDALRCLKNKI